MAYRTSDGIARCPFCGGIGIHENELHVIPILDDKGAHIDAETIYNEFTGCEECGIGFYSQDDNEAEGITIRKWNRRATQPDCKSAYHDGAGCLGYSAGNDDEPIEPCRSCKKYTGNIAENEVQK